MSHMTSNVPKYPDICQHKLIRAVQNSFIVYLFYCYILGSQKSLRPNVKAIVTQVWVDPSIVWKPLVYTVQYEINNQLTLIFTSFHFAAVTPEQQEYIDLAKKFTREEIIPKAADHDKTGEVGIGEFSWKVMFWKVSRNLENIDNCLLAHLNTYFCKCSTHIFNMR